MTNVTDEMVDTALEAWFASPPSETDMGLARSMRAAISAALAATPADDSSNALTGAALGRWCYENPNLAALNIEGLRAATPAADIPPCPKCHAPYHLEGAERYWEARWRDEKAENDRLRTAAAPAVGGERHSNDELTEISSEIGQLARDGRAITGTVYGALLEVQKRAVQPASPLRGREIDQANYKMGWWLAGALEDPNFCAEMKADINKWFEAHQPGLVTSASSASPPEQPPAAQIGENRALGKALDAAIHLINRYRTVASDIQFEQVLDAENDFGLALDELPDEPAATTTPAKSSSGEPVWPGNQNDDLDKGDDA